MSCGPQRGTLRGLYRHRAAGTRCCADCRQAQAAARLIGRVLRGEQRGCYVPLAVLGELLRCATPDVLALAQELLPKGAAEAAEEYLRHHTTLADEEN
jgi:hypothetical protein